MGDSAADVAVPVLVVLALLGFLGLRHELTTPETAQHAPQSFAEMLEEERRAE